MPSYDAIVIGSGVAGLSAACLLAESGRSVAVLEQHAVAGGLLQRFRRRGVLLDTGFHYAGGLGPGGPLRRYLRRLGVMDDLVLTPYDTDGFDEIVLPGRRFRFPVGRERVEAALRREFPGDADGASAFLARMDAVLDGHLFYSFRPAEMPEAPPAAEHEMTVTQALDGIASPDLRAVLAAHTLLYGPPADRAPIAAHAPVTGALFHSCHGVEGGGRALAEALIRRLRSLGGTLLLRADAQRIEVSGGRVTGVDAGAAGRFTTDAVVAAIHPAHVLRMLFDGAGEGAVPRRIAARVAGLRDGPSALIVHGIVRGDPGSFVRRNWFWFPAPEDALRERRPWFERDCQPPGVVVLTGSAPPGIAAAGVFHVFCPLRPDEIPEGPPEEWPARKAAAAQRIGAILEDCVPEWRGRYEILDVSGPAAISRFVRSPGGACYGAECSIEQWHGRRSAAHAGIRGLRIAGQSVGVPGVLGATVTGFLAAGATTGTLPQLYADLRS